MSAPAPTTEAGLDAVTEECDLVMKGGITSGVVYPPAVLALARKYRFRCIGGTSAGAIAAGMTAAAEYDRAGGGFARLAAVSDRLGEGTFLRDLFQPSRRTRPLMATLLDLTATPAGRAGPPDPPGRSFGALVVRLLPRLTASLVRRDPRAFVTGAVAGAVIATALAWTTLALPGGWGGAPVLTWLGRGGFVAVLAAGWLGGVIGGVVHLAKVLVRDVPDNGFGLCNGRHDPPAAAAPKPDVLTDWLASSVNQCAGLSEDGPPLTFGQLAERQIKLRMMTSNLSQCLPYVLPFATRVFLFAEEDMARLFPGPVVDHMIATAHKSDRTVPPPGYHFMPEADDLPVVVAMRMSLSFPLLISAVPLYAVKATAYARRTAGRPLALTPDDLQRNVFSDGGISSNFPVHFFDAWLPTRPTFGINLTAMPETASVREGDRTRFSCDFASATAATAAAAAGTEPGTEPGIEPGTEPGEEVATEQDVFLPQPNQYLAPDWAPVADLPTFLAKILDTARGFHDNAQSMLPSYRERIVQIRFACTEGGLNLAMSPDTIARIKDKGRRAGEALRDQFNFGHHQWVRFRVLMALLETQLGRMDGALGPGPTGFRRLLDPTLLGGPPKFPYSRNAQWCLDAGARVDRLVELVGAWNSGTKLFDPDAPRPRPVLRVTPDL